MPADRDVASWSSIEEFSCRCSVRLCTAWRSAWRVIWKCSIQWVARGGPVEYPTAGASATTAVPRRERFTTRGATASGADVDRCCHAAADARWMSANVKTATSTSTGAAGGATNRPDSSASSAAHDPTGGYQDFRQDPIDPPNCEGQTRRGRGVVDGQGIGTSRRGPRGGGIVDFFPSGAGSRAHCTRASWAYE